MIEGDIRPAEGSEAIPMPKTIIYGAGQMGRYYAELLVKELGFPKDSIAFRDVQPGKAEELAKELGITGTEQSLGRAEVAIVAASASAHVDIILELIEMGVKHILCEKPLALSVEDIARIQRAAEESGTNVYTAFVTEFSPAVSRLTELMRSGNGNNPLILSSAHGKWVKNRATDEELRPSAGDQREEFVHLLSLALRLVSVNNTIESVGIKAQLDRQRFANPFSQGNAIVRDPKFPSRPDSGTHALLDVVTHNAMFPRISMNLVSSYVAPEQERSISGTLTSPDSNSPTFAFTLRFDEGDQDTLLLTEISTNKTKVEKFSRNNLRELIKAFLKSTTGDKPDSRLATIPWANMITELTTAPENDRSRGMQTVSFLR